MGPQDLYPKPGPRDGSRRPTGAPNNGDMGGRPVQSSAVSNSPMEKLAAELPPVAPMPPGVLPGAQAPQPGGVPPVVPPPGQEEGGQAPQSQPQQQPQQAPGQAPAQPASPTLPGTIALAPVPTQPSDPVTFSRMPFDDEIEVVPEGSVVRTPWGEGRKVGGRVSNMRLSEQGKQAWGKNKARRIEQFGPHPWSNDPNAPPPPVEPGASAFNPLAPDGQGWS